MFNLKELNQSNDEQETSVPTEVIDASE